MRDKCEVCGNDRIKVVMWDGARCGGTKITCAGCGKVIENTVYKAEE